MNSRYVPGKRTIKSVIAVLLCMLYTLITQRGAVVSTISALICLKPTGAESKKVMCTRLIATFIGGLLGYLLLAGGSLLPGYSERLFVVLVPLAVLLDIYVCNVVGVREAVVLSCAVLVIIGTRFDIPKKEMLLYAVGRELDTAVGAVIGTLVNLCLWNPARSGNKPNEQIDY